MFMQPQVVHDTFVQVEDAHGETRWVPGEYENDAAVLGDGKVTEKATGWFWRLSAPGYMDQTEWTGPFETAEEAAADCLETYGSQDDSDEGDAEWRAWASEWPDVERAVWGQTTAECEAAIERQRVEWVFGLTGGELHVPSKGFPDEWEAFGHLFTYWYDGPPEWAGDHKDANEVTCSYCNGSKSVLDDENDEIDCPECEGYGYHDQEVRTLVVCCLYGEPETPAGWERLESWLNSGETECPCKDDDKNDGETDENCPLCEGEGYIYLGDGWAEVLYRRLPEKKE